MSDANIYKKLQTARLRLLETPLTKSGKNKFAGYEYFELSDFMPSVQKICMEVGLCGVVSYNIDMAYLSLYDTESNGTIIFSSPMSSAALKGCHEVQNLGAVQSYLRRYLWVTAFEITEGDALDATTGSVEPVKRVVEMAKKAEVPKAIDGKKGDWQMKVTLDTAGDEENWLKVIDTAAEETLQFANNGDDVLAIFKTNKAVFDAVKQVSPPFFKQLMEKFTQAKVKLAEKDAA